MEFLCAIGGYCIKWILLISVMTPNGSIIAVNHIEFDGKYACQNAETILGVSQNLIAICVKK